MTGGAVVGNALACAAGRVTEVALLEGGMFELSIWTVVETEVGVVS